MDELYETIFNTADKDDDGFISKSEFQLTMPDSSSETIDFLFEEMKPEITPPTNERLVSKADYIRVMKKVNEMAYPELAQLDYKNAFAEIAKENTWFTRDEWKASMSNIFPELTTEEINEMFDEMDTDKDGKVSEPEYLKFMEELNNAASNTSQDIETPPSSDISSSDATHSYKTENFFLLVSMVTLVVLTIMNMNASETALPLSFILFGFLTIFLIVTTIRVSMGKSEWMGTQIVLLLMVVLIHGASVGYLLVQKKPTPKSYFMHAMSNIIALIGVTIVLSLFQRK